MNFKKRVNGSWVDTPHYIHKTDTDTITTLPAVIHPTDTTATVGLKGQMLQSSVPSPTSPIMPQGCGDLETSGAKAGQYKIPISSANTTTPVYFGEVETTRKIGKLVLTGEEANWLKSSKFKGNFYNAILYTPANTMPILCSHAVYTSKINETAFVYGKCCVDGGGDKKNLNLYIGESSWTVDEFKAYLAQQYANGTPVTIWYILTTETTGIVNEPLRKIGDYADTVSGITIPTITGKDTFDVLTTLKPSEVSLAYTGWHDATVKEWDGSEWEGE